MEKKGQRGKHKLTDLWEHCPYVVTEHPVPDIPVYEVVRENARNSKPRTLHRNMLLPFTGLPCPQTHKPTKQRKEKHASSEAVEEVITSEESDYRDSSESSADEEERTEQLPVPPYIPPMRRNHGQRGLLPRSVPIERTHLQKSEEVPEIGNQRGGFKMMSGLEVKSLFHRRLLK